MSCCYCYQNSCCSLLENQRPTQQFLSFSAKSSWKMRPGVSAENYLSLASLSSLPPFASPEGKLEREWINQNKSRHVLMLLNHLLLNTNQKYSVNSLLCSKGSTSHVNVFPSAALEIQLGFSPYVLHHHFLPSGKTES